MVRFGPIIHGSFSCGGIGLVFFRKCCDVSVLSIHRNILWPRRIFKRLSLSSLSFVFRFPPPSPLILSAAHKTKILSLAYFWSGEISEYLFIPFSRCTVARASPHWRRWTDLFEGIYTNIFTVNVGGTLGGFLHLTAVRHTMVQFWGKVCYLFSALYLICSFTYLFTSAENSILSQKCASSSNFS